MKLITEQEAQTALSHHHAALCDAVMNAWTEWQRVHLPHLPLFNPRTQAAVMHDTIARELRMRLGSTPGVGFSKATNNRFFVTFPSASILLRVKKLDSSFAVNNYPTKTALKFNNQRKLGDVPKGSRLTLGYRLSPNNGSLLGVFVALLKGECVWKYELQRSGAGVTSIVSNQTTLPLAPILKLKTKPGAKKKGAQNDDQS